VNKPIYAEVIDTCNIHYTPDTVTIITKKPTKSPYKNRKLWLFDDNIYIAENSGYVRMEYK